MNIDQERIVRGDEIDIKSVSNLFSDFIPDQSYKLIDWESFIDNESWKSARYSESIQASFHTCDFSNISLLSFTFRFPYTQYEKYLDSKYSDMNFPILKYIENLANVLGIGDWPYFDFTETLFYFEHNKLKVAYEFLLVDPRDENDDGLMFLLVDEMKFEDYLEAIDDYFADRFIRYMNIPEELKKPLSKMDDDELEMLRMYCL